MTSASQSAAGERIRSRPGAGPSNAEAQRLEALGATLVRVICEDGVNHHGVAMRDPEGKGFDVN